MSVANGQMGVWISRDLTYSLAQWTIMATALRGRDQPAFSVILSVLRVLPVLVPVWLLTEVDAAWRLLASLTGYFDTLPLHQRADAIMTVLDLELSLHFVATVNGRRPCSPVVLNEGRGPFAAARPAWRLMQGARWRFAGLFLLYVAAVSLVSLPDAGTAARASHNLADVIGWVTGALSVAIGSLWSVIVVASYVELRTVTDGPPHDIRRLRCFLERTPSRRPLVRARRSGGSSGAVGGELLQAGIFGEVENEGAAAARRPVRAGEVGCRVAVDRRSAGRQGTADRQVQVEARRRIDDRQQPPLVGGIARRDMMLGHRLAMRPGDELHAAHGRVDVVQGEPELGDDIAGPDRSSLRERHPGVGHILVPRRLVRVPGRLVDQHREEELRVVAAHQIARDPPPFVDRRVVDEDGVMEMRNHDLAGQAAQRAVRAGAWDSARQHIVVDRTEIGDGRAVCEGVEDSETVSFEATGGVEGR